MNAYDDELEIDQSSSSKVIYIVDSNEMEVIPKVGALF
jgi:hypothetical protein